MMDDWRPKYDDKIIMAEFKALYHGSVDVARMKKQDSEEYKAFTNKTGLPVHIVSAKEHLELLPHHESYYTFWQENPIFWLIPLDLPTGEIIGFVMRGLVQKAYRTYMPEECVQAASGWQDFADFRVGLPIVVTEGVKDRQFIGRVYPYTLALLTAKVSSELRKVIRALTRRVVFALDNDKTGKRQMKYLRQDFEKEGFTVVDAVPTLQDWGKYFSYPHMQPIGEQRIKAAISKLGVTIK